ncbi:MAG: hypothetical protein EPN22_08215 [Nitrospirae bacterium]|nr:MAG: hypothetical protein EPN22_08215 [Nitrospirota bacterium]
MRSNRLKTIFASVILLYFTLVAVLPVSALLPSNQSTNVEQTETLKNQSSQANLFFFDLALWEILKVAKRSDNSKDSVFVKSLNKDDFTKINSYEFISVALDLKLIGISSSIYNLSPRLFITHDRYNLFSGLAPPHHLS